MLVDSFLVQGTTGVLTSTIASRLTSFPSPLDALVLFSLGADHASLVNAALDSAVSCPNIYLSECYGIIGYDEQLGRNVELMEKGRGSEYGFVGGSGGTGCLVAGFSGGAVIGTGPDLPASASSCLVLADTSGAWAKMVSSNNDGVPLQYGGITKECYSVDRNNGGALTQVPYFWIADTSTTPSVGVSTFADNQDAGEAIQSLVAKLPATRKMTGTIGLFPCFTRGVNQYGAEDVESTAIGKAIKNTRVYGFFAHGELGPIAAFTDGFPVGPNSIPCTQHSMKSILSLHTEPN